MRCSPRRSGRGVSLPSIRLQAPRHCAAYPVLVASVVITVAGRRGWGWSSIATTRDIYTAVSAPFKWQAIDVMTAFAVANRSTAPGGVRCRWVRLGRGKRQVEVGIWRRYLFHALVHRHRCPICRIPGG